MIELLKEIIRKKSLSKKEYELMEFISNKLEEKKVDHVKDIFNPKEYSKSIKNSEKTANIYVEVGEGTDYLILYAHTDIVPAKEEMFIPYIKENRLYGRGTSDMKTALAGMIEVLTEDYEKLKKLDKKILFAFLADEENSATGAKRFSEWAKRKGIENAKAILMEPTEDFSILERGGKGYIFLDICGNMKEVIEILKKIKENKEKLSKKYPDVKDGFGPTTIEITKITPKIRVREKSLKKISGKPCHASRAYLGINPVEKALELERNIDYIETPETEGPNSLASEVKYATESKELGKIQATAHIDIRTNLKSSLNHSLKKDIMEIIKDKVEINIRDEGLAFATNNQELIEICKKGMPIKIMESIALGGTDAPYLLDVAPQIIAGFGPGSIQVAHTEEEYVSLKGIELTPKIIRQIIKNYTESRNSS